jgi:acid phosphatase type 7
MSSSFPKWFIAILSAGLFTTAGVLLQNKPAPPPTNAPAGANELSFVVHPYLQFATTSSIIVMAETNRPCQCTIEYGLTGELGQKVTSKDLETLHENQLTGLTPRTKYFYRVTCEQGDQKLVSKLLTFQTAGGPDDAYSFAVIGDTQKNPVITGKVADQMWARRPDFVLHMGDVVDKGSDPLQWTDELFKPCRELFSRVCVYPCIGNHEANHANYYKYFALPKPEFYYTFRYNNAQFFVIDTNKSPKPGDEQYQWLERALLASKATWKICYHHHPCYSSDSDDYGNTWKDTSKLTDPRAQHLIPLYEKYGVDLVMNGHIHLYERTHPIRQGKVDSDRGIVHITSGGGGGRLEDFQPTSAFFKNQGIVDYHYCYFTVYRQQLDCHVYTHEGQMIDRFTIDQSRLGRNR